MERCCGWRTDDCLMCMLVTLYVYIVYIIIYDMILCEMSMRKDVSNSMLESVSLQACKRRLFIYKRNHCHGQRHKHEDAKFNMIDYDRCMRIGVLHIKSILKSPLTRRHLSEAVH